MHTIIPSETQVIEIARMANAQHLRIITDGKQTVLCPANHIPPGWYKLGVKLKQAA